MRFAPLFGAIVLGTVLGSQDVAVEGPAVWGLLGGTALTWLWLEFRGSSWAQGLFWVVVVAGAFLRAELAFQEVQWSTEPYQGVAIQVSQIEEAGSSLRVLGDYPPMGVKVAVHLAPDEEVEIGDTVVFSGLVGTPPEAPNPGVFCYKTYLAARGAAGVCWPDQYVVRRGAGPPILARIRSYFARNIQESLSNPGLVLSLVLGDRSQLSNEQSERWRALGTGHLLAISGTHLGLLALVVGVVLSRSSLGRLGRFVVLQAILGGYVLLVGARPSTLRAFLAGLAGGWAGVRRRQASGLEIWALVGCLLLLVEPRLVRDISFQLSFGAAGGILLWGPLLRFSRVRPALRWVLSSLAVSAAAQLSIMPLVLQHFGSFPLLGTAATLIMLPFVTVLLGGGILIGLGAGALGIAPLLEMLLGVLEIIEVGLVKWAVAWQPMRIGVDVWLLWCFFIYSGWRLRQPQITRPRMTLRRLSIGALCVAVVFSLPPQWKYPLEVTALNVGQGDCLFILTPSNQTILIDGGGDSLYWQERGRNVGLERVVPYLKHRGVEKLDLVILSHPHEDHLFGLLAVLENFPVGMVLDNGQGTDSPSYEKYLTLLAEKGIHPHPVQAGDEMALEGGVRLRFLHPHRSTLEYLSHNDASVVVALDFQRSTMLFTGDLEAVGLLELLQRIGPNALKADVVKVPHHGSRSSLDPRLYEAVDPAWALICVGPNSFGHPHGEVLAHLEEQGIPWRTTSNGPVSFYSIFGFVWVRCGEGFRNGQGIN
ncbi:MAG: DNA internalization-related competence protein ComEC/Rec2 [Limnochordia bacterium]|nr:MAG: hypothetical protein AA931_00920 [Peptococcaceae bacterium 1109]